MCRQPLKLSLHARVCSLPSVPYELQDRCVSSTVVDYSIVDFRVNPVTIPWLAPNSGGCRWTMFSPTQRHDLVLLVE